MQAFPQVVLAVQKDRVEKRKKKRQRRRCKKKKTGCTSNKGERYQDTAERMKEGQREGGDMKNESKKRASSATMGRRNGSPKGRGRRKN